MQSKLSMLCVLGKSQYKIEMLVIGKFHFSKVFKSCFKKFRMSKAVHLKNFFVHRSYLGILLKFRF